jgi:flagellar basal-body rod modification protein FlgD
MATAVTGGSSATDPSGASSAASSSKANLGIAGLTPNNFLQMLITELQNQDPMNPTNSDQILQQISEIRNIQSTTDLTTSLNSVALGQSLATASSLIGKQVQGLAADGTQISGAVDSVSVSNNVAELNIGSQTLGLSSVTAVTN